MDMDLDLDLDIKTEAPARRPTTNRFLPRGVKPPLPIKKEENITVSKIENDDVSMDVDVKTEIKVVEKEEINEDVNGVNNVIDEDVDVVVNEIDVYYSPSVDDSTKLYVCQFPLRPMWRPYELDERCKEVRVKPDSGELEIDLSIDVDSDQNYDYNADPQIKITKQTLSATSMLPAQTAYAIGVLTGNKLHLNPVHAVVQLRPTLKRKETVEKNAGSTKGAGIVKVEGLKNVRLPGSSAKQSKLNGESSEQAKDGQEWLPLKYYGPTSDISDSFLHKVMEKEDTPIPFLMSPHDYINTICPDSSNNHVKEKGASMRSLRSLPLDERYKVWFSKGDPVNRFDTLKYLALEESEEEILKVILKYARLVQGNWVAKSPLVYGKDSGLELIARDNVLAQFRKNVIFSGKQLPQRPDLKNATKEVLKVFARPSGSDWKFNTPQDMTFLKAHPLIEEQQEEDWKKLEEQIKSVLTKNRSRSIPKPAVK